MRRIADLVTGAKLEGTETGPALLGILSAWNYREIAKVINEGGDRMPSFSHLTGTVRRRIITHIVAPEPVVDEPSKEVSYTHCCLYVSSRS
ncbi:MAG: hypothetical protein CM1200mP9_03700 [Gammaproteobacteria bacterium]|nr:MAG: hypothetical protein CM1200mP9_03700 [Gammaproteobacteria bacterium]